MDLTAHVPKDLYDLLSQFLPNRQADIRHLREALAAQNFARLEHLAERMYAVGNPYGFRQITTFGRLLRQACADKNRDAIEELIQQYGEYLSLVTIVEVEVPVLRPVWEHRGPATRPGARSQQEPHAPRRSRARARKAPHRDPRTDF